MAEVFNKYGYPCWIKPPKPPKAKERLEQKGIDTIDTRTSGGTQQLLYVSFVCEVIESGCQAYG